MIYEVCQELKALGGVQIDLGSHPLCDDLMLQSEHQSGISVPIYHQKITLCPKCLTAHQTMPVKKELLFRADYRYRSSLTRDVVLGMESLVAEVLTRTNLGKESVVLDIGCNDGTLLGILSRATNATTIGVDPTNSINEDRGVIKRKFQAYFSEETAIAIKSEFGSPDLITLTNVFAHIENLPALLRSIKLLMGDETLLVIENHYLGAIIEKGQFDTFYHEHPRTYSARSFIHIARTLEANISDIQFPSRYGGNIRVFLSRSAKASADVGSLDETRMESGFVSLQKTYNDWVEESKSVLEKLLAHGPLVGKGLPGRAVMLISSLGLRSSEMPAVFEQQSSPKVGHYVPGTDIRVESDSNLPRNPNQNIVIWPWHIAAEVASYLEKAEVPGNFWVPLPHWKLIRPAYSE